MTTDPDQLTMFEAELEEIKSASCLKHENKRLEDERRRLLVQRINEIRSETKPEGQPMSEYMYELVNSRKKDQFREKMKKRVFLAMRALIVAQLRHDMIQWGIRLG